MTTLVPQRGRRPSAGPWAPLFLRLAAHTHPAAGPRPQLWKGGSPSRSPSRGEKPRSPRCYASRSGAERGGSAHPPIHPRPRARGQENHVAPSLSGRRTASLFLSRTRGAHCPPTWGWGQGPSPSRHHHLGNEKRALLPAGREPADPSAGRTACAAP